MQKIEYWGEWKEKCALARCADEAQAALTDFIRARFHVLIARLARTLPDGSPWAPAPPPAEAWHWFETRLQLRKTRAGKAYKEWLFVPQQDVSMLDGVLRGATVLMRDVVRDWLRHEAADCRAVALEAVDCTCADGSVHSLCELLPSDLDTADEVEKREISALAAAEAGRVLKSLERREKIALLAHELGLSLAHPAVIEAADCGKSVLFTAWRNALAGITAYVRSRYQGEDQSSLSALTVGVYAHVRQRIFSWGKSEKSCARLLMIVEHDTAITQP